jgi:hypothetical protein
MRKLKLILTAVLSFLFFLYLTFPFEKLALRELHRNGLFPEKVFFSRFPPHFKIRGLHFGKLNLKEVSVYPSFGGFKFKGKVCSGVFKGETDRKFSRIEFELKSLKVQSCPIGNINLKGTVEGSGSLSLKGRNVLSGKGSFFFKGFSLSKVNFGLFSFKFLDLGSGSAEYKVSGKNYFKVKGELSGRDAEVKVRGSLSLNPRRFDRSYVNLKVSVKVESGSLKGKRFNFVLRGNVNSLRFY